MVVYYESLFSIIYMFLPFSFGLHHLKHKTYLAMFVFFFGFLHFLFAHRLSYYIVFFFVFFYHFSITHLSSNSYRLLLLAIHLSYFLFPQAGCIFVRCGVSFTHFNCF